MNKCKRMLRTTSNTPIYTSFIYLAMLLESLDHGQCIRRLRNISLRVLFYSLLLAILVVYTAGTERACMFLFTVATILTRPLPLKKSLRRSFKASNTFFKFFFLIFVLSNRTKNGKRNSYSPQTIPRIGRKSVLSFAIKLVRKTSSTREKAKKRIPEGNNQFFLSAQR